MSCLSIRKNYSQYSLNKLSERCISQRSSTDTIFGDALKEQLTLYTFSRGNLRGSVEGPESRPMIFRFGVATLQVDYRVTGFASGCFHGGCYDPSTSGTHCIVISREIDTVLSQDPSRVEPEGKLSSGFLRMPFSSVTSKFLSYEEIRGIIDQFLKFQLKV